MNNNNGMMSMISQRNHAGGVKPRAGRRFYGAREYEQTWLLRFVVASAARLSTEWHRSLPHHAHRQRIQDQGIVHMCSFLRSF